ncbi:MAG: ABC transporter ATP-binding protein [Actinobacteria bacterium]|nr:ABC transporter ATP-binding protein [Actinomycetota bacterium]
MTLLSVRNLTVTLMTASGPADAVRNLSFDIERGQILGIAGESGSGKTMTALSIMGLLPYKGKASGSINFDGEELVGFKPKDLRRVRGKDVAMIFQDPMTSLHPMLTIETQLTEHLRHHRKVSKGEARARALELLDTVKIPDPKTALKAHPSQFSGGMRQRIAIAMALACQPKLLIADEPTTALDVTVQAGILKLLDELRKSQNLSVIVITHDLGVLSALTNRLMIMYAGAEVESGPTSQVLTRPRHPYTQGLIDALPDSGANGKRLIAIEGMPPELGKFPTGCAFHTRCSFARSECKSGTPNKVDIDGIRRIFCTVDPFDTPAGVNR